MCNVGLIPTWLEHELPYCMPRKMSDNIMYCTAFAVFKIGEECCSVRITLTTEHTFNDLRAVFRPGGLCSKDMSVSYGGNVILFSLGLCIHLS